MFVMIDYEIVLSYFFSQIVDELGHQIFSCLLVGSHCLIFPNLEAIEFNADNFALFKCILKFAEIIREIDYDWFDSELGLAPI